MRKESDEVTAWLEALCDVFQDDLDRQEDLLALCKAQARAALEHDVELLEARTEAITALLRGAVETEQRRIALSGRLVAALGLAPEAQSLSGLIAVSPSPWRERLAEFQARMRGVLAETRAVTEASGRVMRRSAAVVGEALEALAGCVPAAPAQYDAHGGNTNADPGTRPAMLDTRG